MQIVEQYGLDEIVIGPRLEGLDRVLNRGVGGDHEHKQFGVNLLEAFQELDAVPVGEPHVADRDGEIALADEVQRLGNGGRLSDEKAFADQKLAERVSDNLLVFDDQDVAGILHDQETSVETSVGGAMSECCRTLSHVRNTVNLVPAGDVSDSSMRPSTVFSMRCLQANSPRPVPVSLVVKDG